MRTTVKIESTGIPSTVKDKIAFLETGSCGDSFKLFNIPDRGLVAIANAFI